MNNPKSRMLATYKNNIKDIKKQASLSLALATKRREDAHRRGLQAAKASLAKLKSKQISSKDPEGTAYSKALHNIGSAVSASTSAVSKGIQKRNNIGRGRISWKRLREKQSKAISKLAV